MPKMSQTQMRLYYGMLGLVIFLLGVLVFSKNTQWSKVFPVLNEQDSPCESCILGKHKRDNFPTSSHREKEHLELVHTDLCGPMQTQSIGGSFYFLTFIDDFSRKIWIYFLKNKSETFSKFKEFKAEAEKQSGKFVKVLRSDGGGEYNSKDFAYFCRQQGIIMQTTTRYTPQQNGVAEKKSDHHEHGQKYAQRKEFVQ
jgi:transposase InsO family protein